MDPILQVLFSWQLIIFGLAIATVIYVLRVIFEYPAKLKITQSKMWNELILPLLPIALGVFGALKVKNFPYPGFTPDAHGMFARGDRIIFGLVAGLLSGLIYKVIKGLVNQKIQMAEMPAYMQNQYQPYYPPVYPPQPQPVVQQITNIGNAVPQTTPPITTTNVATPDVPQEALPDRAKI